MVFVDGVMARVNPEPMDVPPQEPWNQSTTSFGPAEAVSWNELPWQTEPPAPTLGAAGTAFTTTVMFWHCSTMQPLVVFRERA